MTRMMKKLSFIAFLALSTLITKAHTSDTILIKAGSLQTGVLKTGTHRYLVYYKMGKDSNRVLTQFWTRKIEKTYYEKIPALKITQSWEDKDSIMHTATSYCNASTLQPLYHEYWWNKRGNGTIDFINKSVILNGIPVSETDTAKQRRTAWSGFATAQQQFVLNWHLDLETFPTLPFKAGRVFAIPFYEPGSIPPVNALYSVTGEAALNGYNNKPVACWILSHEDKGNQEKFWISKKTREVLKLEQSINNRIYRYKVKLAFSE